MKKMQLLLIGVIMVAIVVLILASNDTSTYGNFTTAAKTDHSVKIVGTLVKDKPLIYDPAKDPNYFSFYMKDNKNIERQVVLRTAKPQDFERSEQIVLTGQMKNDVFMASDMLMKCPSKYKEDEIYVKSKEI